MQIPRWQVASVESTIFYMKMHEPVANSIYGPLILRATLGVYFFLAGITKLDNMDAFVQVVRNVKILPPNLALVYAILLPYFEVFVGILLVLGIWTTLAAILASAMLVSYIVAIGMFPHQGSELFNKDVILLAGTLSLLFTGSGAMSVDRFRKSG